MSGDTPSEIAKPGMWTKLVDRVKGNIEGRGIAVKSAKIGGATLGAVITGYGLKDLGQVLGVVSPDVDEQGREIPADTGKLIKGLAEVGAGALMVHQLLLKGPKANGSALG